jgi:glutamate synthase (NADPH/NADH) large chain
MTGGVVVVLGKTGRNFAAGMSGGVAYVLDEEDNFDQLCKLAMVELEPILAEDALLEAYAHQGGDMEMHGRVHFMTDMTRYDAQRLNHLIQNHKHYTGSRRAQHILENWHDYLPHFIKVMPVDYREALKQIQAEQISVTV